MSPKTKSKFQFTESLHSENINVAKLNFSKVNLESVQSVAFPFSVLDLQSYLRGLLLVLEFEWRSCSLHIGADLCE